MGSWQKEFLEFSSVEQSEVPNSILENVRKRLFPNPWMVFAKVLGIHAVVGTLSLAICAQFGLNPFQTGGSLAQWFMQFGGHEICMVGCGLFFMSATYLVANGILSFEELETVRRFEWLQLGVTGLFSLAAFHFFGAELVVTFAILWLLGAFIGGFLSIEGSYRVRRAAMV